MNNANQQSPAFIFSEQQALEAVEKGITRKIMGHGPELMVVKVWFEEGAEGYQHQHPHSQISYVEQGEFLVTIDGKTELLKTGDSFYVEPHKLHGG